jgi:hypothetical protein
MESLERIRISDPLRGSNAGAEFAPGKSKRILLLFAAPLLLTSAYRHAPDNYSAKENGESSGKGENRVFRCPALEARD